SRDTVVAIGTPKLRRHGMPKSKAAKRLIRSKLTPPGSIARSVRPRVFAEFVAMEAPTAAKINTIRRGINAPIVNDMLAYFHVPQNVIFAVLLTPPSTAHRLIKSKLPLDPAASERVVRVADITRIAEDTFGGRTPATTWLKTSNLALENATPLSMLDTEPGA